MEDPDRLTNLKTGTPPKIFLVSIDESSDTRDHLKRYGIQSHLLQPIEPSQLYNSISKLFVNFEVNAKSTEQNVQKPNSNKGFRILLAEDNQINQLIARTFLTELGYNVQTVSNGQEVLEVIKQSHFDLILMDCQMPVLDGLEASVKIRETGNTIPIIALTANAMKGDQERCLEAGMTDYMTKPFKKAELKNILEKWLTDSMKKIG